MKTLCPNCEKETESTFICEVYACRECDEDNGNYEKPLTTKLQSELTRLTERVRELEDANRWIPVSECNPKYSNWYDVLRYDKTIKQLCQLEGYYFSSESRWQEPMYGENEPVLFWRENLPLPDVSVEQPQEGE